MYALSYVGKKDFSYGDLVYFYRAQNIKLQRLFRSDFFLSINSSLATFAIRIDFLQYINFWNNVQILFDIFLVIGSD